MLLALLMAMFVSMLSNTVVSTSLPVILADLDGTQSAYTWVITANLLATSIATPIWGKAADLFNRKVLIQIALAVFVTATMVAGLSQDTTMLITMRVVQGLGGGGIIALSQIVMADVVSPRERGKYAGMFGAVTALGTVGGPLLGGVITDSLGWRWNFYVALPFAVVAIIMLQRTLRLPAIEQRRVQIDYLGIALISTGFSALLLWVTLGGSTFAWASATSIAMVSGAVVLLALAVWAELRAPEPLLPLPLFRDRTFALAVVASLGVGVAMFGTSVYLSQYMQLARGATPTMAGVMTIPMMGGLLLTSSIVGGIITRTGRWKRFMVTGGVLMIVGSLLLSQLHYDTPFWQVAISMATLGAGVGMLMQNLVLVTQNAVDVRQLGVATAGITFFRMFGGSFGVSLMGAVLGSSVASHIADGAADLPAADAALVGTLEGGAIPNVNQLPEALKLLVESAYGLGVGLVFLTAVPLAVVVLVAVIFLPNVPLGTRNAIELRAEEAWDEDPEAAAESALAIGADLPGGVHPGDGEEARRRVAALSGDQAHAEARESTRVPMRAPQVSAPAPASSPASAPVSGPASGSARRTSVRPVGREAARDAGRPRREARRRGRERA
ncbi:EmrB/QacA subfamily drug resistance transporter [Serinibacter salmoneus]|uniref:EmrB/QacA subfamily drug resistance transporter n=1 Tax=Serinibacter salmoneus TaxID=556530 RepID=A0A2A9D5B9_9MICO|nr:EmrB/QacA subfamily drug resistance transporter [Serinibacter salmoneus]